MTSRLSRKRQRTYFDSQPSTPFVFSHELLRQPEHALRQFVQVLQQENFLSDIQVQRLLQEQLTPVVQQQQMAVPMSIFAQPQLTTFEVLTKYLHEHLHLSMTSISKILHRSVSTISTTYHRAVKKIPLMLHWKESSLSFPFSAIHPHLSILESIVVHLKEHYHLSNVVISGILQRDNRTIWTVYNRAKKKRQ